MVGFDGGKNNIMATLMVIDVLLTTKNGYVRYKSCIGKIHLLGVKKIMDGQGM